MDRKAIHSIFLQKKLIIIIFIIIYIILLLFLSCYHRLHKIKLAMKTESSKQML